MSSSIEHLPAKVSASEVFEFLMLPGEIRNKIYRNLLIFTAEDHEVINVPGQLRRSKRRAPSYSDIPKVDLTILHANRQIHEEASSMFYGENRFLAHVNSSIDECGRGANLLPYERIAPDYWLQIRRMSVVVTSDKDRDEKWLTYTNWQLAVALATIKSLQELRVFVNDCNTDCYYNLKREPAAASCRAYRIHPKTLAVTGVQYFDLSMSPINTSGELLERYRNKIRAPAGFPSLSKEQRYEMRCSAFEEVMGKPLVPAEEKLAKYRIAAWAETEHFRSRWRSDESDEE